MPKFKRAGAHGSPNKKAGRGTAKEAPPAAKTFRCSTCYSKVEKGKKCTVDHFALVQSSGLPFPEHTARKVQAAWNRNDFRTIWKITDDVLSRVKGIEKIKIAERLSNE